MRALYKSIQFTGQAGTASNHGQNPRSRQAQNIGTQVSLSNFQRVVQRIDCCLDISSNFFNMGIQKNITDDTKKDEEEGRQMVQDYRQENQQ